MTYYIGDEAVNMASQANGLNLKYPMADGIVSSWDTMEKYWNQSIYHYLKADPQEHNFVLVLA